jgi:putative FMN-dependent luciferase-like monooxygenase
MTRRLAFFSRLLDDVAPAERYRLAAEQIVHAERHGFESAWVAQHHFDPGEGGLPSPLVFLSHVAAQTSTIRLGTGILTLPLEDPVRVAEDASVLDALSGGRLDLGLGSGGTASSFPVFGQVSADRGRIYEEKLATLLEVLGGAPLGENSLFPDGRSLLGAIWQATFSASGGERAGRHGHGLMLSRTQPRSPDAPDATLWDLQAPIIDAYLAALPAGAAPRIVGSRTLFVADDRDEALYWAERGLRRVADHFRSIGQLIPGDSLPELITALDVHVGTPDDVIESLLADRTLDQVTDLTFQVHSVDPPHELILRSIELIAAEVAPALGWSDPRLAAATAVTTSASTTERERV